MSQGAVFLKIQWIDLQRYIFTCRRRKPGPNSVYFLVSLPLSTSLAVCCIHCASSVMFLPQLKKQNQTTTVCFCSAETTSPAAQLTSVLINMQQHLLDDTHTHTQIFQTCLSFVNSWLRTCLLGHFKVLKTRLTDTLLLFLFLAFLLIHVDVYIVYKSLERC